MAITEVFPNPTVKRVIYQITFPNLFFIEDKIGEFQIAILDDFPNSELITRTELLYANIGPDSDTAAIENDLKKRSGSKIWKFSNDSVIVNLTTNSIDISSTSHKTYNNETSSQKFRDEIEKVISSFLSITKIPKLLRIGLRYIDEIPIVDSDVKTYSSFINSAFNLDKFDTAAAKNIQYVITTQIDGIGLNYREQFTNQEKRFITLDYDGFLTNVPSKDFLKLSDDIHTMLSKKFEETIKEPVYDFMRQKN